MFTSLPLPLVIVIYILCAAGVVFCTVKASNHIDEIDSKTNIGSAVLGGILLAAVTSLPELITSIVSVTTVGQPELAIGNIFGSNLFNMMILCLADVVFIRKTVLLNADKGNKYSNFFTLIMYLIVMVPCFLIRYLIKPEGFTGFTWFSLISVAIAIVYVINAVVSAKINNSSDENEESEEQPQSIKKNVIWFVVWSICLVGISILITNATEAINAKLQLDASFAGALFLGVATSLPELTSVFNLVRLNNAPAAIGGITGSSLFNITIITVADFVSSKNIYSYIYSTDAINPIILLILGLISVLILMYSFLRKNVKNKILYIIPSVLVIGCYLTYIIISTL